MGQTLISAGSLITGINEDIANNRSVLIENGRIAAIGDTEELSQQFPQAEKVGGKRFLLMPAMIDAHDHGRALGTAPLGVSDTFLEAWIPGLWAQPSIEPYLAALYDGLCLIRSGVGTVVHYHNPRDWANLQSEAEATLRGYSDAGIRVIFCPPFLDQNQLIYINAENFIRSLPLDLRERARPFAASKPYTVEKYLEICRALMSKWRDTQHWMSDIQINPVGGQWVSDESLRILTDFAVEHEMRVQMHMLETMYQRQYAYRTFGKGFLSHLDEMGVLGSWLTLAHMVWIEADDIPLLLERGVGIVSNPGSNLRLRSGTAPLAKMNVAGLKIGLGLDGHGMDDDQDFLREMRLAWFLANRPGMLSDTLSARDVFAMATSGGAKVTWGGKVDLGEIFPGALADLVLIDEEALRGVWYSSRVDALEVLLQHGRIDCVNSVMINGRWVFRDHKACNASIDEIGQAIVKSIKDQPDSGMSETAAQLMPYIRQYYAAWQGDLEKLEGVKQ